MGAKGIPYHTPFAGNESRAADATGAQRRRQEDAAMSLWGEIEYEDKDDLWVGENDELRIEIFANVGSTADAINDNTLRALEGVEVTPLEQR